MRLICPNCAAQYEIPAEVVPAEGRDVQCSNCTHTWFQAHQSDEEDDIEFSKTLDEIYWGDQTETIDISEGTSPLIEPLHHQEEPDDQSSADQDALPSVPKRSIDPSISKVLQEEAERERAARQAENIEEQTDLGLDNIPPIVPKKPKARRDYIDPDISDLDDLYAKGAAEEPVNRSELLPDIEEINDTLTSNRSKKGTKKAFTFESNAPEKKNTSGSLGFAVGLGIIAVLFALYVFSPKIISTMPQSSHVLKTYVNNVDKARGYLDTGALKITHWLEIQAQKAQEKSDY